MKNQDIFPSEFFVDKFFAGKFFVEEFFREIFQSQKNFLESFPENAVKNFIAGVNAIAKETQEDERYWEEGGIRIQENSPKSGGREETQTK